MTCPYCNSDLKYDSEYYSGRPENFYGTTGNGIYYPSTKVHLGDIYFCPNREGFENIEDAIEYKHQNCLHEPPEDLVCDSANFNGFFHTDKQNNLHEGYPC